MRVLERFQRAAKLHHLAASTVRCYHDWIVDYLAFHRDGDRWRHPRDLGGAELGVYLTHLAADRRLSASSPFRRAGTARHSRDGGQCPPYKSGQQFR